MSRERQEPRVVDRVVAVVAADHDFHVVIEACRRDPAQVLEGADVLADGRGEVLRLDEVEVLPPRVAQHVAEGVHAAAAFVAEIEIIRGVIHLCLMPRGGLEPPHGLDDRSGSQPHAPVRRGPCNLPCNQAGAILRWIRRTEMSGYRASRSAIAGS